MAVKVRIQTEADVAALDRYQKELDETRKKLIASGKPLDEFTKEMRKLDSQQRALNKLTPQTTSHFGKLKDMFGGFVITGGDVVNATRAVIGAMWDTVQTASSLTEAQNKVGQVFNDSLPAVRAFGERAAESIGMSERAALSATGTYGNLFRAFGIGEKKAADMSMELVQLAADLASFNDTSIDDALEALRSGISGETEPLKRYGVALNDARMKQEALNMGIYDGVGILSANEKAQAAYAVIMKDTAIAQGDFARNSDELANSLRTTEGAWEDLKAAWGTGFTDESAGGVSALNDVLITLTPVAEDAAGGISSVIASAHNLGAVLAASFSSDDDLTALLYAYYEGGHDATMSLIEFKDVVAQAKDTQQGYADNLRNSAIPQIYDCRDATDDLTSATEDMTDADGNAIQSKKELARAMDGTFVEATSVEALTRKVAEATNDSAQADIAAKEALEDYSSAVKEHGEESDEAKKAKLRLEDAERRAADAAADARVAQDKLTTATDEAAQAARDAAAAASSMPGVDQAKADGWLSFYQRLGDKAAYARTQLALTREAMKVPQAPSRPTYEYILPKGAGGVVTQAEVTLLGERGHTEYVITTEPAYRSRSLDLYEQLGDRLGVSSSSVTIAPGAVQISVSGSSASPTAIAAEVEAALRRIVRSSQLMGA